MSSVTKETRWVQQGKEYRDPAQITSHWSEAGEVASELLNVRTRGAFWDVLVEQKIRLIVSREYEHLVLCLSGNREQSFMRLPHPSGVTVDLKAGSVHIATTRNPNEVFELKPALSSLPRGDAVSFADGHPLVPVRTAFYPGCTYIHDLAMVGADLFACAVGHNAIAKLSNGDSELSWWPKCIEKNGSNAFDRNYIQLNSIAAGATLGDSFFSASTEQISSRRPGHLNFPVNKRGVVFSGKTREPIARGLTRPHSARLHGGDLYVNNSGYGELSKIEKGDVQRVAKLAGWTRGLALHNGIAFVGTSRILPRFSHYAPGVNAEKARCRIYAMELNSGRVLGFIEWPAGNQIFAIEVVPEEFTTGFPFSLKSLRSPDKIKQLFYAYDCREAKHKR